MIKDDLTALSIKDACWHQKPLDRSRWMDKWSQCSCDQQDNQANQINNILCYVCHRSFRHECDKACHKCISRDNYQYRNKLEQCSVVQVRDG